jgi:hypothetical protein
MTARPSGKCSLETPQSVDKCREQGDGKWTVGIMQSHPKFSIKTKRERKRGRKRGRGA